MNAAICKTFSILQRHCYHIPMCILIVDALVRMELLYTLVSYFLKRPCNILYLMVPRFSFFRETLKIPRDK
jgi:hypothetical protein